MRHVIERLLIKCVLLIVSAFFIGQAAEGLVRLGRSAFSGVNGSWLEGVLFLVVTLTLVVGLGVRIIRAVMGGGAPRGREHEARERQSRNAVRRLAQNVPVVGERAMPVDRDPALSGWEDTR